LVEVPNDEHVRAILTACESDKSFVDRRDGALIRLLADAGLRREEAVMLDLDDLDLPGRAVYVRHGKGGKSRVVAIGDKTALALSRWLRARKASPWSVGPAVFLSTRGARMTGGAVAMMLNRRCDAVGVPRMHPHQLRHGATHALLAAGVGEQAVEHQMGWTGGAMVRRYGAALAAQRSRDLIAQAKVGDRL
jgi:integrase